MRILKQLIFIFLAVFIAFCASMFFAQWRNGALADSGQNTSGWAWAENVGWIGFNGSGYGVNVDTNNGKLSGFAWSENIGWISFNESTAGAPPSDDPCPDATCIAKANPPGQLGKGDVQVEGWARALSHGGGWDGWIRFDHGSSNEPYLDSSGDWHGWAWGSDVVGWINFNGTGYKVTTTLGAGPNNPPTASVSSGNPGSHDIVNYCDNSPSNINLAWVFSDPDAGDSQTAYQLSITRLRDNSTCDTGKQTGSGSSIFALNINSICGSGFIGYDISDSGYSWKVKVWDLQDVMSEWSNTGNFTAPKHQYPEPSFIYSPHNPRQGETVQFNDNNSQCFDGDGICNAWSWDFENNGSIDSTEQNPLHEFGSQGTYITVMNVADSDSYLCPCSESIGVQFKMPSWREILPW